MNFENFNRGDENENNPIENNEVLNERREEVSYLDNAEIRKILEVEGVLDSGEEVSPEDFETTVSRAKVLLNKKPNLTKENALALGFLDRKTVGGEVSSASALLSLGEDWLADYVKETLGEENSEEQFATFMSFLERGDVQSRYPSEVLAEWIEAKREAGEEIADVHVVVDKEGRVLATGESEELAARKALEEDNN